MAEVLIVKYVIVGIMWSLGWIVWFAHSYADVSPRNLGIAMAPWILAALYLLLFWWG